MTAAPEAVALGILTAAYHRPVGMNRDALALLAEILSNPNERQVGLDLSAVFETLAHAGGHLLRELERREPGYAATWLTTYGAQFAVIPPDPR